MAQVIRMVSVAQEASREVGEVDELGYAAFTSLALGAGWDEMGWYGERGLTKLSRRSVRLVCDAGTWVVVVAGDVVCECTVESVARGVFESVVDPSTVTVDGETSDLVSVAV